MFVNCLASAHRDPEAVGSRGYPSIMSVSLFANFPAREYVAHYYSYVGDENAAMLDAILRGVEELDPLAEAVVEVGSGPSVVPLLALAAARRPAGEVHFLDVAESNLDEVRAWLSSQAGAFDYGAVLDWLAARTGTPATACAASLRDSAWSTRRLDMTSELPDDLRGRFDTLSSHFFAESATDDLTEFVFLLAQLRSLCRPAATIFLSFMRRSLGYEVAGTRFPAVHVDEHSLPVYLEEAGFALKSARWSTTPVEDPPTRRGYEGMVFVAARLSD
jgi:hypothetical protein